MKTVVRRLLATLLVGSVVFGCASPHPARPADSPRALLSYLGQAQIPFGATVDGVVIGGLSGISYDAGREVYYAISDDRSEEGPVRFFSVRLSLSDKGIDNVSVIASHTLLDRSGEPFEPLNLSASPPVVPPDPEGIAFDPQRQRLYWSSEGERLTDREPVLVNPWIWIAGLDGHYLGQFTLPANLAMSAQLTGPRHNQALEGLALAPDGRSLYAAMEEPRYDDGPETGRDHRTLTRITKFDVATAEPTAQFGYPLEAPVWPASRNGVSDLVALSDTSFLVVERSVALPPVIRVFRTEITGATDVLGLPSMRGAAVTPASKSLAVDLSTLSNAPGLSPLHNVEGITLGPKLSDGRQSVVLVSDDDFSPVTVTQFLLFAMD
ncbi:hypothetical protein MB901379_03219 [Mycobacterium basiliense]|uniref:Phytase-like domain-containing protein n=1 Tax=Mycobacterium basiliense TaxID=2094119 RepID=A0A3S4DUQ7_9MYCO|nr:esterase-like activity of phytase family protein [Mycobacterium basiliense]VDM89640.1 hypothetical protein MB901379_03219 [Mycobacterium basiliense]